jgi:hypothetical protein
LKGGNCDFYQLC